MSDTREAVDTAVGRVLFSVTNYPERAQVAMLGQDTAPLRAKVVDAVMAALAEQQDGTQERSRRHPLAHECPFCHAASEEPCASIAGQGTTGYHPARWEAARVAQQDGTQVGAGEVEVLVRRALDDYLKALVTEDEAVGAVLAALPSLGYTHPRTVSTADELDAEKVARVKALCDRADDNRRYYGQQFGGITVAEVRQALHTGPTP